MVSEQPPREGSIEESLERAEDAGDEARVRVLEELHDDLQAELDRDVDETAPPGR